MPFHYLSHHLKSIQPLQFFSHFKTLQQQPSEQKIWIHLSTFQLQHTKSNLECVCTHALYVRTGIVLGEYCYIIYYKQRRGGTSAGLSSHFIEFEFCPIWKFRVWTFIKDTKSYQIKGCYNWDLSHLNLALYFK